MAIPQLFMAARRNFAGNGEFRQICLASELQLLWEE
jgi:hypothetical protein